MAESKRKAITWIMLAIAAWGTLIALGVLLPAEWDWAKWTWFDALGAGIVLALTGTLLLTWYLFLRTRERRKRS